jgi:tRNA A37 threonylcarbamoyltransferase TsaD
MILGIECTAHTFGVGIVQNGKILSNVKDSYAPKKGGIIPRDSATHHREVSEKIYSESLEKSGINENKIEGIAIANSPGLAPCLLAGMEFSKKKAKELNIPLIPVNHCIAHLEIGQSVGARDPVLLYASGANTQIIAFTPDGKYPQMHSIPKSASMHEERKGLIDGSGKYRIFGETLDSGVGNFIDTFARHAGIAFPGGPEIEKKAKNGKYIELPYSIKGMDVSFSGLLTKMKQLYDKGIKIEDLSFSMQETAFAMLVESAERAMAHTNKNELVLGGGVGCNMRLQEMCRIMCEERGAQFYCPAKEFLVDNGAMIAYTGELMFNSYKNNIKEERKIINNLKYNKNANKMMVYMPEEFNKLDINPRERTDQVKVIWKK